MSFIGQLKSTFRNEVFLKYFKNTSWLFAEKVLRIISGLVVGVWVARYLGPSDYGLFNYALSFVGIFMTLSTLGLDSIVIRELVKNEDRKNKLLGTSFLIKIMGAITVLLLLVVATKVAENNQQENILIFIIASSTLLHSFNVIDFHFQSKVLSKYAVYANMGALLVSSLLKVTLILLDASLVHFAWVMLYESIVFALGLLYFYRKTGNSFKKWVFDKALAIELLKDSWPLILSGLMVSLYMKIDQIMIKSMISTTANGMYSAALRISETWYFIPVVICGSLFPAIINSKEKGDATYLDRLQKLYDFMVIISFAVAIPITFFHEIIIDLLFGEVYGEAATVLMIHIWSGVFVSLGLASGKWLIIEGLQRITLYRTTAGALVNIVLNLILIPQYGIIGAAFTTLFSQMVSTTIFDLFYKKTRPNFTMKLKALFFFRLLLKNRKEIKE